MREPPFVSCIITAYNMAAYLGAAIESALGQDFPRSEREVIVVDDGSTDGTAAILARYGGRIRSFRQDNAGQGAAMIRALRAARGEIIAPLDADDVWLPAKISRSVAALEGVQDAVVVSHECQYVDKDLRPIALRFEPRYAASRRVVDLEKESLAQFHAGGGRIVLCNTGSATVYRKSAVEAYIKSCRPPAVFADGFFTLLALSAGGKAVILGDVLSLYRRHGNSVTERLKTSKPFMEMHVDALRLIEAAGRRLLAGDLRMLLKLWTAHSLFTERRKSVIK